MSYSFRKQRDYDKEHVMDLVFIGFFSFFIHFMCNTLHSTRVHTLCVMLLFNFMLLGGTRGVVRRVFVHLSVN